jgi:geranylgeranyl pyrophosphate synthase
MKYSKTITSFKQKIEAEIQRLFSERNPPGLYRPMTYLLESGGKRIRPLLVLLSCQVVGGAIQDSLPMAAAIELFHTFTLVHDDIMDNDDTRRGKPTVHNQWDESTAILAGDGLVILAYESLLKIQHPQILAVMKEVTEGLMVLHEGQALDKSFEEREDVSIQEYREMIEKKTAKLVEVACVTGGIIGNGSEREIQTLRQFARAIGVAFQIQDDLLDVFSDESVTGKTTGSDIIEKKRTYITIHFFNYADESEKKELLNYWGKRNIGMDEIRRIRDLFRKTRTDSAARLEINKLILDSDHYLDDLPQNEAKENLKILISKIKNRVS